MTSYPSITFRDLMTRVESLGFQRIRQKGSHIRYVHPDGRKTTIPDHGHKDVPKGLWKRSARLSADLYKGKQWIQEAEELSKMLYGLIKSIRNHN